MKTHRYNQIIMPLDRYLNRLTPAAKRLVGLLEGGLLLLLLTSVLFYV
jgi:hypothetical protein